MPLDPMHDIRNLLDSDGKPVPGSYLCDAMAGLRALPDRSVDTIITDPAYSSMEKHRAIGTTTRLKKSSKSSNEWFPVVPNEFFGPFFQECHRVMVQDSYLFVMCDDETSDVLKPLIVTAGFEWRKRLVWAKHTENPQPQVCGYCRNVVCCRTCGTEHKIPNQYMGMGYPFRAAYEFILFAQKGRRKAPDDRTIRDTFTDAAIRRPDAYPTEKPQSLLEKLVLQATDPGDLVLDPFAGSGTTLAAALALGRTAIGFDVQETAIDWQVRRLAAQASQHDVDSDLGVLDLF